MQITIHDTNELSKLDLQVLRALVGDAPAVVATKAAAVADDDEDEAPKPAPKKAPAKKAVAPKPKPAPEPEDEDEDEPAEEDEADDAAPTIQDAVERATALVSSGEQARVKEALASVGAKKVSELKGKEIAGFLESLGPVD